VRFVDRHPCDRITIVIIGRQDGHPQMLHHRQRERVVCQQPFLGGECRAAGQELERDRLHVQPEATRGRDL